MADIIGEDFQGELIYSGDKVQLRAGRWSGRIGTAERSPDVGMVLVDLGAIVGTQVLDSEELGVIMHSPRPLTQGMPHG